MSTPKLIPNAENCTLEDITRAAKAAPRRPGYVRLMAIVKLLEGYSPEVVASFSLVSLRTLYNWVKRFNTAGIDGLIDRPRTGAPRKIPAKQAARYKDILSHPEKAGVTHWTGVKFHGYLTKTLQLEVGYRTVIRWLHQHDFRLKIPQPWPDRQDETLRQAFLKELRQWLSFGILMNVVSKATHVPRDDGWSRETRHEFLTLGIISE